MRKESAVDMMAATTAATTRPDSIGAPSSSRKRGAALSAIANGAIRPCATRAGTARPTPTQMSRQRA